MPPGEEAGNDRWPAGNDRWPAGSDRWRAGSGRRPSGNGGPPPGNDGWPAGNDGWPPGNGRRETGKTQGLTNPSSATEAGEARRNQHERLPASLCSLERVVRPAPTERTNVDRRGLRRGNDGPCRRERVNGAGDEPERQTADTERAEWEPAWLGEREPVCRPPTENERLRA